MIVWLALRDRLYTKQRLHKWGRVADEECHLCGGDSETTKQSSTYSLTFECPFSIRVENKVLSWVGVALVAS